MITKQNTHKSSGGSTNQISCNNAAKKGRYMLGFIYKQSFHVLNVSDFKSGPKSFLKLSAMFLE